jgi:hypothetical protein
VAYVIKLHNLNTYMFSIFSWFIQNCILPWLSCVANTLSGFRGRDMLHQENGVQHEVHYGTSANWQSTQSYGCDNITITNRHTQDHTPRFRLLIDLFTFQWSGKIKIHAFLCDKPINRIPSHSLATHSYHPDKAESLETVCCETIGQ